MPQIKQLYAPVTDAQHMKETIDETSRQLSQVLSVSVPQTFDVYKQNIEKLIAEYLETIPQRSLTEKEYKTLFQLFQLGHVNEPILFYAFENLKKQDTKHYMQRMFKYGFDFKDTLPEPPEKQESYIVDEMSMMFIIYQLKYKNVIRLEDLDDSPEKIHEKVRRTFIVKIKEYLAG